VAETDNVAKLKEGYRLRHETRAESVDYWLSLLADDVQWCSLSAGAPGMEFTHNRTSKADVKRYFAELSVEWDMIHYTAEEFIAQGDRVVVLSRCEWRNKRTGKSVETPKADIFRFRDGQIVEFFEFYDTARAIAAAMTE